MNFDRLILSIINAHYNWMMEEGIAPQILVNTQHEGVIIPKHLKMNPTVILKITMAATSNLSFNETNMTFNARFNGQSFACTIPLRAIIGWPVDMPNGQRIVMPNVIYPKSELANNAPATAATPVTDAAPATAEPDDVTPTTSDNKVVTLADRRKKT